MDSILLLARLFVMPFLTLRIQRACRINLHDAGEQLRAAAARRLPLPLTTDKGSGSILDASAPCASPTHSVSVCVWPGASLSPALASASTMTPRNDLCTTICYFVGAVCI